MWRGAIRFLAACLAAVLFLQCNVAADPVELEAVADTTVRTDQNSRRNDNYGRDGNIVIGGSRGGGGIPFGGADGIRSLILFDLSSITLPVTSAILEVTLAGFFSFSPPETYQLEVFRIVDSGSLTPWNEGNGGFYGVQVDAADGVAWVGAGDGGDANNQTQPNFDPTAVAALTVDETLFVAGDKFQWDITALVKGWQDGTYPNFGVVLRDVTDGANSFRHVFIWSREEEAFGMSGGIGPRLHVEVVPEPGTLLLVAAAVAGVLIARRRASSASRFRRRRPSG